MVLLFKCFVSRIGNISLIVGIYEYLIIYYLLIIVYTHTFIILVSESIALFVNTSLTNPCSHLWPMLLTSLPHYQYIAL